VTLHLERLHQAATAQARVAPALLFVHGAFSGAWCWQPYFFPWFAAQGFDCWAVSLEGHGASDGHQYLDAISIADYQRNLSRVISGFSTPPIVIGHSMGGLILQHYLQHTPLPGAAFLASVPPSGMASSSLRMLSHAPTLFMALNLYQNGRYDPGVDDLRALLFSHDTPSAVIEAAVRQCQPESQRAVMDMAMINPYSIQKGPYTPTLVLGAADDQLIAAEEVAATAQHFAAQAEMISGIGHMMMLDTRWPQVAERLLHWLEGLDCVKASPL
jgi:pimeloyl-ACP methyl ester carboxylesterase